MRKFAIIAIESLIIVVDKLYWVSGISPPSSESNAYYFSVDSVINSLLTFF
jgi:hypothetical protein